MAVNLMSMEDLFYGPPEPTYILPTPEEAPPLRYMEREMREREPPRRYIEREIKEREYIEPPRRSYTPEPPRRSYTRVTPPRRSYSPEPIRRLYKPEPPRRLYSPEPIRQLYRPEPPRPMVHFVEPRSPAVVRNEIRPIERLARVHTVPEPVAQRAPLEEIRKVVEVPVPVRVEVPVPVPSPPQVIERIVHVPAPALPPPVEVVRERSISPPIQRPVVYHPIQLKVPMCCEKCAKKVKDRLLDLEGVEDVVTDQFNQRVTVYGHVDPERVLNRVKHVKKRSAFWDMTVDYSKEYRQFREAQEGAARADQARARAAKAQAVATQQAKAMVAPAPATAVVVDLPQERHGPKVRAILPGKKERAMPYAVSSRAHSRRFVSPPRAYRQEFSH